MAKLYFNLRTGILSAVREDSLAPLLRGLAAVGCKLETRRASEVEPDGPESLDWKADLSLVGGPVLAPFGTRAEALLAETDYLHCEMRAGRL